MIRSRALWLAIAAALVALAAGWILGRASHEDASATVASNAPASDRKPLYYRNPMGLADTSPVPKKDSMGMDYIPVYADYDAPSANGMVTVSPEKLQMLGVRKEPVRRSAFAGLVRASGTVEIDETRQYAIAPRFEGWVEQLYANQTGMHVRAGQPLLAVYSPQLVAAQQEYRLADAATRRLAASDPASAASMARLRDAARARLRNWDISDTQLAHLGHDGGSGNLVLTSPANAVVVEKPVVQGARFEAGDTILRLADLSTVWVMARVPAGQVADVAVGQPARFESTTLPGRSFTGGVKFVQPIVDAATRTVDVRIAFSNPDGELRPGLFGTVLLEQPAATAVLNVPRSAVLDSGTRKLVLVQAGSGRFAPREVTTGRRAGERIEILSGLDEGENVVVSANFLIDAESNLQAALDGLGAQADRGTTGDADKPEAPGGRPNVQSGDQPGEAPHVRPAIRTPTATRPPPFQQPMPDPHGGHGTVPDAQATPPAPPGSSALDAPAVTEPHAAHRAGLMASDDPAAHEGH